MDKTNYTVLSLVAIVAVVAILSMFLRERASGGLPEAPSLSATANAIFDVPRSGTLGPTGNAVYESSDSVEPQSNRYDLNENGRVDEDDAEILGNVIDRVEFCPRNKICDWNGDSKVTIEDLTLLNVAVLEQQTAGLSESSTGSSNVNTFAIATTGGIA